MLGNTTPLKEFDPELFASIEAEKKRQEEHIELIASENYKAVVSMWILPRNWPLSV